MDGIRELLMGIYAVVWAVVVIITVWRTGEVPNTVLAALGVGEGALMALFRADDALRRNDHPSPPPPKTPEVEKNE